MDERVRKFRHKAEELRVAAESCHNSDVSRDYLKIAEQYDILATVVERRVEAARADAALTQRHRH